MSEKKNLNWKGKGIFIITLLFSGADMVLDWMAYTEFTRIDFTYQHESYQMHLRKTYLAGNILGTIIFLGQLYFVVKCFQKGKSNQTIHVLITLLEEVFEDLPIAVVTLLAWMSGSCSTKVSLSFFTIISRMASIATILWTFGRAVYHANRSRRKMRKHYLYSDERYKAKIISCVRSFLSVVAFLVMFVTLFIDCIVLHALFTQDTSFIQRLSKWDPYHKFYEEHSIKIEQNFNYIVDAQELLLDIEKFPEKFPYILIAVKNKHKITVKSLSQTNTNYPPHDMINMTPNVSQSTDTHFPVRTEPSVTNNVSITQLTEANVTVMVRNTTTEPIVPSIFQSISSERMATHLPGLTYFSTTSAGLAINASTEQPTLHASDVAINKPSNKRITSNMTMAEMNVPLYTKQTNTNASLLVSVTTTVQEQTLPTDLVKELTSNLTENLQITTTNELLITSSATEERASITISTSSSQIRASSELTASHMVPEEITTTATPELAISLASSKKSASGLSQIFTLSTSNKMQGVIPTTPFQELATSFVPVAGVTKALSEESNNTSTSLEMLSVLSVKPLSSNTNLAKTTNMSIPSVHITTPAQPPKEKTTVPSVLISNTSSELPFIETTLSLPCGATKPSILQLTSNMPPGEVTFTPSVENVTSSEQLFRISTTPSTEFTTSTPTSSIQTILPSQLPQDTSTTQSVIQRTSSPALPEGITSKPAEEEVAITDLIPLIFATQVKNKGGVQTVYQPCMYFIENANENCYLVFAFKYTVKFSIISTQVYKVEDNVTSIFSDPNIEFIYLETKANLKADEWIPEKDKFVHQSSQTFCGTTHIFKPINNSAPTDTIIGPFYKPKAPYLKDKMRLKFFRYLNHNGTMQKCYGYPAACRTTK